MLAKGGVFADIRAMEGIIFLWEGSCAWKSDEQDVALSLVVLCRAVVC